MYIALADKIFSSFHSFTWQGKRIRALVWWSLLSARPTSWLLATIRMGQAQWSRINNPIPHCSYLDIYISQNIRFCKSDFEEQFQTLYRPKVSIFWSENSDLLFSFSFYFWQNLSNPLLFAHCCCYSKELTCLNCVLMLKSQFRYVNSLK